MVYQPLDDRPNVCEGCGAVDYPSHSGPSVKQMTWNPLLCLWLCVDCRYSWSNWVGTNWGDEADRKVRKPMFLVAWEKKNAAGQQTVS